MLASIPYLPKFIYQPPPALAMSDMPISEGVTPSPAGGGSQDNGPLLNPRVALILAIVPGLFGFLGIGYLYMRRWGMGLGMLVFGWVILVLPALGSIQTYGPDASVTLIPVVSWTLAFSAFTPENIAASEYGFGTVVGSYIAKWIIYLPLWGWSIRSALRDWE